MLERLEAAEQHAAKAFSLSEMPMTLKARGLVLMRQRKFREALEYLTKASEIDPYEAEVHWLQYETYAALDEAERAMQQKTIAEKFGYQPPMYSQK